MRQIMLDITIGVLSMALVPVIAVGGLLSAVILKTKQIAGAKN